MVEFEFGSLISKEEKVPIRKRKTEETKSSIVGDKTMNKDQIIDWFVMFLNENKKVFTLDWLRGQKLTFESVSMRKNV